MALSDINPILLEEKNKNGYEVLRDAIKKYKIEKITKRDALFLINKQMEGISETNGNLFIYMFYFSCTDPSGTSNDPKWYTRVIPNDTNEESTFWCACYASFALNFAGITNNGHWNSSDTLFIPWTNLTKLTDFDKVKTMDTVHFGDEKIGHIGFVLKENPNKKNNYNQPYYVFGGNQSDGVNIIKPQSNLAGFGTSNAYDDIIYAGDFLSVLAYFVGANLKTIDERIKLIKCRINSNDIDISSFSEEVFKTRALIQQNVDPTTGNFTNLPYVSTFQNAYLLSNNTSTVPFKERFKELLIFEESLKSGAVPLTTNISGNINPNKVGSTQ